MCICLQVAIKFESTSSKGCSNGGPPYEWQVYTKISGCYGIPKIFAKGTQAGFYIMVSRMCFGHSLMQPTLLALSTARSFTIS